MSRTKYLVVVVERLERRGTLAIRSDHVVEHKGCSTGRVVSNEKLGVGNVVGEDERIDEFPKGMWVVQVPMN